MLKKFMFASSAIAALTLLPALANAQFVAVFTGTSLNGSAPLDTIYNYNLNLQPGTTATGNGGTVIGSSLVTFYDVPGLDFPFVSVVSSSTALFTDTTQLAGRNPRSTAPTDNPLASNVTVRLSAASPDVINATGSPITLGVFHLAVRTSSSVLGTIGDASDANVNGGSTAITTVGTVTGPMPTPEPGSVALLVGMSVAALRFARRPRRR